MEFCSGLAQLRLNQSSTPTCTMVVDFQEFKGTSGTGSQVRVLVGVFGQCAEPASWQFDIGARVFLCGLNLPPNSGHSSSNPSVRASCACVLPWTLDLESITFKVAAVPSTSELIRVQGGYFAV